MPSMYSCGSEGLITRASSPGCSSDRDLVLWLLSWFFFWITFPSIRKLCTCSKLTGCDSLPDLSSVQLCKISLCEGMCGLMGYDLMLRSKSSIVCPEAWGVERKVFIVFICHSIHLLDFGYAMWPILWAVRNLVNVSEVNRGPLSVDNLLGGPYCDISCLSFCMMVSADLE